MGSKKLSAMEILACATVGAEAFKKMTLEERTAQIERFEERIEDVLKTLTDREREIVKLGYGINPDGTAHTFEDIGKILGITPECVRQVDATAMRKLQYPAHRRKLDKFLASARR